MYLWTAIRTGWVIKELIGVKQNEYVEIQLTAIKVKGHDPFKPNGLPEIKFSVKLDIPTMIPREQLGLRPGQQISEIIAQSIATCRDEILQKIEDWENGKRPTVVELVEAEPKQISAGKEE